MASRCLPSCRAPLASEEEELYLRLETRKRRTGEDAEGKVEGLAGELEDVGEDEIPTARHDFEAHPGQVVAPCFTASV